MHDFIMITGKNESKILTKDISCKCKSKFDYRKCNSNQKQNNNKCRCKCKKHHLCQKDYTWNPATCSSKSGRYLVAIIDNSVITVMKLQMRKIQNHLQQVLMKKSNL